MVYKRGAGQSLDPRPLLFHYCSVAAALTAAAASAAIAAAAASTAAAMLMRVPGDPAYTAKHDGSDDDRRQIEISSQELHHNNALLSARFEKFLLDLGNVDLDLVVVHILVGTDQQVDEGHHKEDAAKMYEIL